MSLYFIALEKTIHTISYVPNPSRGLCVRKREYLFHSIKNKKPILFLFIKKKEKQIYSILDKCQYAMGNLAYFEKRRIDSYPSLFIIRIADSFFFIESVLPSLYV
jgi:hypothetical protein